MKMKFWSALALVVLAPAAASAHRIWLLPSATTLSGDAPWVSIDGAVSSELFYFDHRALKLDDVQITDPDGAIIEKQHMVEGQQRSAFDFQLTKPGTYRVSSIAGGVSASYMLDGEQKRWRGKAEDIATAIPANATQVDIAETSRRIDTFVTAGAPSPAAVKPTGKGLEIVFDTHPNDLYAGEIAKFRLLMNGKGVSDARIAVASGGGRYNHAHSEMKITTGKKGAFEVTWPGPGMYWLNAELEDDKPSIKKASKRSASYSVTLEVLPQ